MTEQQADTCDMCHRKEKENPDMEIWSCYTLCTKCADKVSEYITCQESTWWVLNGRNNFFVVGNNTKSDNVDESSEVKTSTNTTVLDLNESLDENMSIWYDKDDEDRMWIYIDILEKGITMTMGHWEFQSFVQNLEMANFKLSKVREIEREESCDCDKCVEQRKGQ